MFASFCQWQHFDTISTRERIFCSSTCFKNVEDGTNSRLGKFRLFGVRPFSGVTRICCEEVQRLKLCHGALTVDFRAGCSSCSMTNSFVTNAVLNERAVSCWHLHQLISQTAQYLDSWLSDLLQSELKMKLLEVEGGGHVPHSWRRHWNPC